jgi:hypothetical protein
MPVCSHDIINSYVRGRLMIFFIGFVAGTATAVIFTWGAVFISMDLVEYQEVWNDQYGSELFWLYLLILTVVGGIPGGILGTIFGHWAEILKRDYRIYSALGGFVGGLACSVILWWQAAPYR